MDAHVFRLLAKELSRFMHGARVEKIHSPALGLLALSLYNQGLKRVLMLRHNKTYNQGLKRVTDLHQDKLPPALYLSSTKLPNPAQPGTMVMTLRKYLAGHRLGSSAPDWLNRRIFFFVPGGTPLWLCLDLITGPSLHHELPDIAAVSWPEQNFFGPDFKTALQTPAIWKNFSVLTPALRKTIVSLDNQEAAALLADLQYEVETNRGDLRVYNFNGEPQILSAWPLPAALTADLSEAHLYAEGVEHSEPGSFPWLECARSVYEPKVLAALGAKERKEGQMIFASEEKRLQKTLLKLDQEEERLKQLVALREKGILLQSMLWRLSAEEKSEKRASISIPPSIPPEDAAKTSETDTTEIELDPRHSVSENLRNFFKQSERGLRGLNFVAERRKIISENLLQLQSGINPKALDKVQVSGKAKNSAKTEVAGITKLIQRFVSSDGFVILRGRSALGNQALLKLAWAHDLWMHVQGGPSAHVVIRRESLAQDIPERTLLEAGALSALKSWKKDDGKAEIITALVKDVRPVKGGAPGSVLVDKIKQGFMVTVDHELETRLR
jgi:predicted ribosome quality control (RQC) complex YloA/Tae2 family protein